jgi:alkanesulfonate monooxygenase SsuD/methylene tetrahydromethanopterin reductase-like flavin-dependent oxidoreductase (luciferase family)
MLEETLEVCLQMWSGDEKPYRGKHYQPDRPLNSPQSLSRPHPGILIGGSGEQKTLRLVARFGDACNLWPTPEIPHKLEVLRGHCEAVGRDYDTIEKTAMLHFDVGEKGEKIEEIIGQLHWLAGMGIQTVIGGVKDVWRIKPLEIVGERLIPAIAKLEAQPARA